MPGINKQLRTGRVCSTESNMKSPGYKLVCRIIQSLCMYNSRTTSYYHDRSIGTWIVDCCCDAFEENNWSNTECFQGRVSRVQYLVYALGVPGYLPGYDPTYPGWVPGYLRVRTLDQGYGRGGSLLGPRFSSPESPTPASDFPVVCVFGCVVYRYHHEVACYAAPTNCVSVGFGEGTEPLA